MGCYLQITFSLCVNTELNSIQQMYHRVRLTLGATPSSDVAGVVVGQDLTRGGEGAELDVVVERSIRGQTQKSNVIPEGHTTCPQVSV